MLRIASGDIIDVDTLLTNTPTGLARAGVADDRIQASLKAITRAGPGEKRGPGGHILTGPVYVEGAEPGDALEVKILSIDLPIDYGYNGCSGFLPENCDAARAARRSSRSTAKTMTATFAPGIVIPLQPFFGSMGVAPRAGGRAASAAIRRARTPATSTTRSSSPARRSIIPVHAPGALFEIGDGHAAQGDGEVDQTAIETSLRGRLQLTVRKGMKLAWPRAETATDYISMAHRRGSGEGDEDRDPGDGRLPRRDKKLDKHRRLSAGEHRRQRRDHPARRRQGRRAREDAEGDLQMMFVARRRRSALLRAGGAAAADAGRFRPVGAARARRRSRRPVTRRPLARLRASTAPTARTSCA